MSRGILFFLPLLTSAFREIMKLSSAHISATYSSSHFFQASVGTLEGGAGSYMEVDTDVCPEWPPFSGPEIHLFHPQLLPKFQTAKYLFTGVTYKVAKLVY